jgi:hypothetical protein
MFHDSHWEWTAFIAGSVAGFALYYVNTHFNMEGLFA